MIHRSLNLHACCATLLLAMLVCIAAAGSVQAVAQPSGAAHHSVIEIPLRIPLDRLFEVAERELPREAGQWRNWRKHHGINIKYRAWRGPLLITMNGAVLTVQAQVHYWIRAQKQLLGTLDLKTSCGVGEAPRRAIIGTQIRLDWGPDWTLRPAFRVMPTRFLDRCEMTFADIDVTPLVAREFERQMQEKMTVALASLAPRLAGLRRQAHENWVMLQQPVALWADQWLLLNPAGIALSPLAGQGRLLDARLAVLLEPQVVSGARPASLERPLPPLMRFYPHARGLNLQLSVALDLDAINRALGEQFTAAPLTVQGRSLVIEALKISGQGQALHVRARLGGDIAGDVELHTEVAFDPESQQLQLVNLGYDYQPEDVMLQAEAGLFYGYIRRQLETAANRQLQDYLEQGRQRLRTLFTELAPDGARVDMRTLRLQGVQLEMAGDTLRLHGRVSGHVALQFE